MKILRLALAVLFFVSAAGSVVAQEWWTLKITRETKGLHIPFDSGSIKVKPAFDDYAHMMHETCEAMKLTIESGECAIYPQNGKLPQPGAFATVHDGNKLIVYDRSLSRGIGYFGAMAIIAHEVGHHYCRHMHKRPFPKLELEADRFAGAAMRRNGAPLDKVLLATEILSKRASLTHPGRSARRKAIEAGWRDPQVGATHSLQSNVAKV